VDPELAARLDAVRGATAALDARGVEGGAGFVEAVREAVTTAG
jgi:hypothetical protein